MGGGYPPGLDRLHPLRPFGAGSTGACWLAGSARPAGTIRCVTTAPHPGATIVSFFRLKFGPLVWSEDVADTQEHLGVRLFQLRACLRGVVDLSKDLVRVRRVGSQHR